MAKKSRTKARDAGPVADGEVGPRQPCPCGSGKRYKACHGAPGGAATSFVARPFEGLPGECDIVALRELVPAATAPLTRQGHATAPSSSARCCPMAAPAMVRDSGEIWLGLQVQHTFGDPSRDLGAVLLAGARGRARRRRPHRRPGPGPRLQDLVDHDTLDVTVHDGFDFWIVRRRGPDGVAGRAGAGQRRRHPDRPADVGRGGVLDRRRHQGAPALGDARARGRSCSTRSPACTPRAATCSSRTPAWSACSAPTACSPRSGTSRSAPAPRRSRSPAAAFKTALDEALADDTAADHRGAGRPSRASPTARSPSGSGRHPR